MDMLIHYRNVAHAANDKMQSMDFPACAGG